MTMAPDPHAPRGNWELVNFPVPRDAAPPRVTVFNEQEAERIAAHIHATTFYSVLHDDERRETRGGMIVAALAGWAFIAAIVGVILVVL